MIVYVIQEHSYDYNKNSIIGVVDDINKADELIKRFYVGDTKNVIIPISYRDIRDSGIEWVKELNIFTISDSYRVKVWVECFTINSL
jgi:hypothetical protein